MVVKYTEKGPKQKKFKTTARLDTDEETGKCVAEIASYKPKDENKEVNVEEFEITKVELRNMSRDSDNHLFQVSAKKMLTRSEKDGQEKRELKRHINILAQFIDSIDYFGALPISHASKSFGPTTPKNKKLMGQVQRAKIITGAMEKWIEGVIRDGEKYITSFRKLCDEMQCLIAEIQNQIVPWEKEKHKWENVLPMLTKIEEYRATKFLAENSIKLVDECQLFVLKKTIMWRVLTIKSVISDARASIYELQDLQCSLVNENKVVNPNHDWQLGLCGLNTQDAIKAFRLHMEKVKAKDNFTPEDITQVTRIESMIFIGND